jgi:hypothetical protein
MKSGVSNKKFLKLVLYRLKKQKEFKGFFGKTNMRVYWKTDFSP